MDGSRFDRITNGLAASSSRRRLLAGFGAVATGSLLAQSVAAAPSPRAGCMKQCNAEAKETRRGTCAALKNNNGEKLKTACLKEVQREHATCRQGCR